MHCLKIHPRLFAQQEMTRIGRISPRFNLQPLSATLAKDYALGPFAGTLVVAGKVVTKDGASRDCYLEVVIPERICEFCFLLVDGEILREVDASVTEPQFLLWQ
jgi:hypothetical protein